MKHVIAVAALALLAACTAHHTESDSKSNWLRSCSAPSDCPEDATCACGVCTKACENADACDGLSSGKAVCLDPDQQGLPECRSDSDSVSASRICLLACKQHAECGTAQSCVHGVCISAALADAGATPAGGRGDGGTDVSPGHASLDGGKTGHLDAGTPPIGALDAGKQIGTLDAGETIATLDAGHTKPTNPPPTPDDDEDAGVPNGPDGCPIGLVRHLDGHCVEAGVDDAKGVAMLDSTLRSGTAIFAVDLEYVYGVSYAKDSDYAAKLVRWPADGGEGEVMAMGTVFQFVYGLPAVVDADRLYFIAAGDPSDLSATLWSMPKDDSAPPIAHGYAGRLLAQDQDYLYFTNDGDSRVVRTGKATLDSSQTTEQIYVSGSDAPNTIVSLAINTDSVLLAEVPPHNTDHATYTIQRVAKATNAISTLATSDRFSGRVASIVADDTYFVLGDSYNYVDRLSLATGEVKPFALPGKFLQIEAGALYGANNNNTPNGSLWRLDLSTAHRQNFLTEYDLLIRSTFEEDGTMFVTVFRRGGTKDMLVRVTPKP